MIRIFPDDFQFSRWFQNQMTANFPDDFKTIPIFQMTANFPDYFKTGRIFPDECQFSGWFQNCLDLSRWPPIFWMISKVCGIFQMQMVTPIAANFVLQTNFCLGGRGYPKFCKKNCAKNRYFGPKNPFSYISALFGPHLTLLNTQTPFLALLGKFADFPLMG